MSKSNIVALDIILRRFKQTTSKTAYNKLYSEIQYLIRKDCGADVELFAAEMVQRYKNFKYPFC